MQIFEAPYRRDYSPSTWSSVVLAVSKSVSTLSDDRSACQDSGSALIHFCVTISAWLTRHFDRHDVTRIRDFRCPGEDLMGLAVAPRGGLQRQLVFAWRANLDRASRIRNDSNLIRRLNRGPVSFDHLRPNGGWLRPEAALGGYFNAWFHELQSSQSSWQARTGAAAFTSLGVPTECCCSSPKDFARSPKVWAPA
jgi:hypothetical protein